jgi:hypothetical protein
MKALEAALAGTAARAGPVERRAPYHALPDCQANGEE